MRLIAEMIAPGTARPRYRLPATVLLIAHLFDTKGCDARGIEIDMAPR